MPDAITYCEACDRMIMPADLAAGNCLKFRAGVLCETCAAEVAPEQRAALEDTLIMSPVHPDKKASGRTSSSRARRASERRRAPSTEDRGPEQRPQWLPIAVLGAGFVVAFIAALMMTSGGEEENEPAITPIPGRPAGEKLPEPNEPESVPSVSEPKPLPPTTPADTRSPAARRLAEIEAMITPDLERHGEIVSTLRYFGTDFEGTPEVALADQLLRKVQADYVVVLRNRPYIMQWEFDSGQSTQGWRDSLHIASLRAEGGFLTGGIAGDDPMVHSPRELSLEIRGVEKVFVMMRNGTPQTRAQFFFVMASDRTWDEAKSKRFEINAHDPEHTEYVIDLSDHPAWRGTLVRIRLDPVMGTATGTFSIDYIRIGIGPAAAAEATR